MSQTIIGADDGYRALDEWLEQNGCKRLFLVCGQSIVFQKDLVSHLAVLEARGMEIVRFSDFQPNPLYESVAKGVERFHRARCDTIMAAGGGSAMDVAKCVKLYSNLDPTVNYLEQDIVPNGIPFLAMPTTAGTGSEATRYAVIYYEGKKQSVTHESCIPGAVLFDPGCLRSLPLYQKKATMMDALCHAIESFWSVNSTPQSRDYSREAIRLVMANMDGCLQNSKEGNLQMLRAANTAGKAINIAQTTAGHAMCYKITSLFGCAHGHAAALCLRALFPWTLEHMDRCIDPRGQSFLEGVLGEIARAVGCDTPPAAAEKLEALFRALELEVPSATQAQHEELRTSVNPVRLKNHPIALDEAAIDELYHRILR